MSARAKKHCILARRRGLLHPSACKNRHALGAQGPAVHDESLMHCHTSMKAAALCGSSSISPPRSATLRVSLRQSGISRSFAYPAFMSQRVLRASATCRVSAIASVCGVGIDPHRRGRLRSTNRSWQVSAAVVHSESFDAQLRATPPQRAKTGLVGDPGLCHMCIKADNIFRWHFLNSMSFYKSEFTRSDNG
jgi:hypothetical protein